MIGLSVRVRAKLESTELIYSMSPEKKKVHGERTSVLVHSCLDGKA